MPNKTNTESGRSGNLMVGLVLVLMGLFFLSNNFFDFYLDNWWALFILIPAFMAFNEAWKLYKNNDSKMTRAVKNRIVGGVFPLTVALIFLLDFNWATVWPIFIIIIGVSMLFD
ncbi:MAG: hypothetical protein DWQ05_10365 [Calditrichaeota bacterium]|nr:MAG: hypothetical protein DWQ05_10365 [Calditrichota bacterium]